jgi:hypothetical protein
VIADNASANGEIRRLMGTEDPDLETLVRFLPTIASSDNLDGAIQDILRKLVAGRGTVVVPALR